MLKSLILPALVASGFVTPAFAQDAGRTAFIVVDMSAPPSAKVLRHRIAAAVEEVCGSYATIEPYQVPEIDACRKSVWTSADRQVAMMPRHGEARIALSRR